MDGPERLEDDARPARRWTWVVVAVAVAAVVGLGAVRLSGLTPPTTPPGPGPGPTTGRTPTGWPAGLAPGTLYVRDAGGIVTIDLGSGLVQRASLDVDPTSVTMTAGLHGVLVWPENGSGTAHEVAPGVRPPGTVTGRLAQGRQFLPGPGLAVWATPDDPGGDGDRSTWRLVDEDGSVQATVRARGLVTADGAGGLFAVDDVHVRHVVPGRADVSWDGSVSAVGPDGWETMRCATRCEDVLHDRTTDAETLLGVATPSDFDGPTLSPSNRFVASTAQLSDSDDSPVVVRVAVPGSREERTILSPEDGSSFGWISDRWLAATSEQGLVLYDAVDDRLVTPDLGLSAPSQVVVRTV